MFSGLTSYLLTLGGALVLLVASYVRGRLAGAKSERDKRAAEDIAARDIADAVEKNVGAMLPDDARKELGRWAK